MMWTGLVLLMEAVLSFHDDYHWYEEEHFPGFTTYVGKCTSLTSNIVETCMDNNGTCSDGSELNLDGTCTWPAMLQCGYSDYFYVGDCIEFCLNDDACLGVEVAYWEGDTSWPEKCEIHRSWDLQAEPIKCWSYDNRTDEFSMVGDGNQSQACRRWSYMDDTSYGHATSEQLTDASLPDCKQACRDDIGCWGIEYKGLERLCELHFLSVDYSDAHYCYIRKVVETPQWEPEYRASLSTFEDYDGDFAITGEISVAQPDRDAEVMVVFHTLSGLPLNESGSIIIYEGTSCGAEFGDELFNEEVYDVDNGDFNPWSLCHWTSDRYGKSFASSAVNTGYPVAKIKNRVVSVELEDESIAACGVLEKIEIETVAQSDYDSMKTQFLAFLIISIILSVILIAVLVYFCCCQPKDPPIATTANF